MKVCSLIIGVLATSTALGAGFEKSVLWSGKEAGTAGAGGSVSRGSQSVAFNPAGLASDSDITVNVSPTWVSLKGSLAAASKVEETEHNFSPPGAFSVAYRLNEKFGFGVGAYVAGGSKAIYDGVDLTVDTPSTTFSPRIATDLKIMEYAVGAGYEVMPGFRIGAAWRILQAEGSLATLKKVPSTVYSYVSIREAKDTKYTGFRLGAQFDSSDAKWGAGLAFRNNVSVVAEGSIVGQVVTLAGTTIATGTSGTAKVATRLPWAASVGGYYHVNESIKMLLGVDYVNYSKNKELGIEGSLNGTALPNIALNWKNMWNFRLGGEYKMGANLALRGGYSLTTRVTSKEDSRATISPPGTGHLFTVGAGTKLMDNLDLDGALEYAFNSGSGAMTTGGSPRELLAGVTTETKAKSMAIHTGVTYRF